MVLIGLEGENLMTFVCMSLTLVRQTAVSRPAANLSVNLLS